MVESENALQESIKRKGDKSYYYAHAPRNNEDPSLATVLEGEGIVTGGDPKLLIADQVARSEQVRQIINIRNYNWHDDDDKVVISTPFEDSEDKLNISFTKDSIELVYEASATEVRKLILRPLNKAINPDASSFRIRRGKVVISLMKEDIDQTWYSLLNN